jgi:hypothetical protein
MPIDTAAAYLSAQRSVEELVRAASPEELDRTVPACPLWRVRDVVSHVTGVARDVVDTRGQRVHRPARHQPPRP